MFLVLPFVQQSQCEATLMARRARLWHETGGHPATTFRFVNVALPKAASLPGGDAVVLLAQALCAQVAAAKEGHAKFYTPDQWYMTIEAYRRQLLRTAAASNIDVSDVTRTVLHKRMHADGARFSHPGVLVSASCRTRVEVASDGQGRFV